MSEFKRDRVLMGITGASGAVYGRALLDELTRLDLEVHLIVSPTSHIVMREELDITFPGGRFDPEIFLGRPVEAGRVVLHSDCLLYTSPSPRDS